MEGRAKLSSVLEKLPLGSWQYHHVVGSTNDLALDWAVRGAPDWALVVADSQTAGRGRAGRRWVTHPGSALALSLVMRPAADEAEHIPRFTALAGLGLVRALARLGLGAELKWPNDVLLKGRKVAGVLVEAAWQADALEALVMGLGVNIARESLPGAGQVRYPAASVEGALGNPVDRWELLGEVLLEMMALRRTLADETFQKAWNEALAFRGEWCHFQPPGKDPQPIKILGVGPAGELQFINADGRQESALAGEILMVYNESSGTFKRNSG